MVSVLRDAAIQTARPLKAGEVQTHEGGIAFEADKWVRLNRFLILGTEKPFYSTEMDLTVENIGVVKECLAEDPSQVIDAAVGVSHSGRAPKNDPAILALAMAATDGNPPTRQYALSRLNEVCRTGTHLLHFVSFMEALQVKPTYTQGRVNKLGQPIPDLGSWRGGWGRALKRAVANWFRQRTPESLAYQAIKYQSRDGWALADLLKLTHLALSYPEGKVVTPGPDSDEHKAIYRWIMGAENPELPEDVWTSTLKARDALHRGDLTDQEVIWQIQTYGIPREAVPTELLNRVDVWDALLADMPMTAMVRNLGKMSAVGLLTQGSEAERTVCQMLWDGDQIRKARVHPIALLIALKVYEQGHGERGKLNWTPSKNVINALDGAFYASFGTIVPTGKRIRNAVDVSGSMQGAQAVGSPALNAAQAAAAMALVSVATEPNADVVVYSHQIIPVEVRPSMRLDEVMRIFASHEMGGGTFCSLPIETALREDGDPIDAFVSYTDSETWNGGDRNPQRWGLYRHGGEYVVSEMTVDEALRAYRHKHGRETRNAVVAFAANEFTLANPTDPGQLDCAGLDAALPGILSDFIRGDL